MKRIGRSDLEIYPLGLGGNTFGNRTDAPASEKVLNAFVEGEGNFIDTADAYSYWKPGNQGGESETIIGDWMHRQHNRTSMVIATKVGGLPQLKGLAPETVQRAADASLKRLRTDYIDLYYAHYDDETQSIEDIAATFDALVKAGKVRYVGISNVSPDRTIEWLRFSRDNALAVPIALQPEYNLVARRNYEQNVEPIAREFGLGVFPYFGLASGFLTGKYRTAADLEGAARAGAVKEYMTEDGLKVIEVLRSVAEAHNAALATVALAWLLAKPTVTAPLSSATSEKQLAELLAAPKLNLDAADVKRLDEASQPFA